MSMWSQKTGRGLFDMAAASLFLFSSAVSAQEKLDNDEKKGWYAFGYSVAAGWRDMEFTESQLNIIMEAMRDSAQGNKPKIDMQKYVPIARKQLAEREARGRQAQAAKQKEAGKALAAREAAISGAKKTASGLVIRTIKEGTGKSPSATSKVTVHYHGTLGDGTVFDSSVNRGQPATFPLNGVIKCWTEGVQMMKEGGKSRLVCPSEIAYGDRGAGQDILPGATLIFDVELIKVN